jgi:hypothetical protein
MACFLFGQANSANATMFKNATAYTPGELRTTNHKTDIFQRNPFACPDQCAAEARHGRYDAWQAKRALEAARPKKTKDERRRMCQLARKER